MERDFLTLDKYSDDDFLGSKLHILQARSGYRAGLDSVILAASIPVESGDLVLEPGIGSGVAALCVNARVSNTYVTGVDIDPDMVSLAIYNAERNGFAHCLSTIVADITVSMLPTDKLADNTFDHAFANPPFYLEGRVQAPKNAAKRCAHLRRVGDLELWIRFMIRKVKVGGSLTLILPAEALDEVLAAFHRRAGDTLIFPVFPRKGAMAHRIIIQSFKGARGPLRLLPGIILHEVDGRISLEADKILRKGYGTCLAY